MYRSNPGCYRVLPTTVKAYTFIHYKDLRAMRLYCVLGCIRWAHLRWRAMARWQGRHHLMSMQHRRYVRWLQLVVTLYSVALRIAMRLEPELPVCRIERSAAQKSLRQATLSDGRNIKHSAHPYNLLV